MNIFQRGPMSPQQMVQARRQLDQQRQDMAMTPFPTTLGEGIASLGPALAYRINKSRLDSQFPAAPPAFGTAAPAPAGAFPAAPPPPVQAMPSFQAGAGISGQGTPQPYSPGVQKVADAMNAVNSSRQTVAQSQATQAALPSYAKVDPIPSPGPGQPFGLGSFFSNLFGGGSKPTGGGLY